MRRQSDTMCKSQADRGNWVCDGWEQHGKKKVTAVLAEGNQGEYQTVIWWKRRMGLLFQKAIYGHK